MCAQYVYVLFFICPVWVNDDRDIQLHGHYDATVCDLVLHELRLVKRLSALVRPTLLLLYHSLLVMLDVQDLRGISMERRFLLPHCSSLHFCTFVVLIVNPPNRSSDDDSRKSSFNYEGKWKRFKFKLRTRLLLVRSFLLW